MYNWNRNSGYFIWFFNVVPITKENFDFDYVRNNNPAIKGAETENVGPDKHSEHFLEITSSS